ncbi:hypothetical protein CJU01_26835 [Pseudomonas aeruginosa]|nr:hypothetical protein CD797_01850 [Pseudomonas aeruginosa]AVZ32026.1 hypothetical protein B8B76_01535 [Pseudomonas aeruginosa]OBY18978.1 hypothetical protein A8O37_30675 [Pseudomonas aeruginosa]PBW72318.1 hypothetical protein CJU01_26835 [Pseudomonas aeruginosa]PBX03644.1 hypothetical protein CJT87_21490 [Pseudomonas aeruginosa]
MSTCFCGFELLTQRCAAGHCRRLRLLGLLKLGRQQTELPALTQCRCEITQQHADQCKYCCDDDDLGSPLTGLHMHS